MRKSFLLESKTLPTLFQIKSLCIKKRYQMFSAASKDVYHTNNTTYMKKRDDTPIDDNSYAF